MTDFIPRDAEEALADAWASIDGKLDEFRSGRDKTIEEQLPGGYYSGYLEDAHAMIQRLKARGYSVVFIPDVRAAGGDTGEGGEG
jgi:hypothetical protein